MKMSNKTRKIVGALILVIGIMMQLNNTANAVYNEEEDTISYSFIAGLSALGMKPDYKLEADDDGMIWTRTCSISDLVETAKSLDGECDINGDGVVYMWYSIADNIGSMTIVGEFTYYYADDDEAIFNYYQLVFECDEDGDIAPVSEDLEEIYW